MTDSFTFGNCTAYKRQDTATPTWCVLRGNADVGLWFDTETQACVMAALLDCVTEDQWNTVKRAVFTALNKQEAA